MRNTNNDRIQFFCMDSERSLNRARDNFNSVLSYMATPYYDFTAHVNAAMHPFYHTVQLASDIGQFVYGTTLLVGVLAKGNTDAAGKVFLGMLKLVLAAALEIANIALSLVSLAMRFVVSICNFGYSSTNNQIGCSKVATSNQDMAVMRLDNELYNQNASRII